MCKRAILAFLLAFGLFGQPKVVMAAPQSLLFNRIPGVGRLQAVESLRQQAINAAARNIEWFETKGTDASGCDSESGSGTKQEGWPGFVDSSLTPYTVGATLSICYRRRSLLYGGSYGPWQYATGTIVRGWRTNGSVLGVDASVRGTRTLATASNPEVATIRNI